MPFAYGIVPTVATFLTTSGSANTELPNMAIRGAARGVTLTTILATGRGSLLTTISGIAFRVRRWTTAGSGGTAVVLQPRWLGTTPTTTAASSESAITAGTVSGAYQIAFGCSAGGPGGWTARNQDYGAHLEGGSNDEFDINSISTTTSLNIELSAEVEE